MDFCWDKGNFHWVKIDLKTVGGYTQEKYNFFIMKLSKKLKNRYFIIRHGESKANIAEIILSHLEHETHENFTLTQKGKEQVRDSAEKVKMEGPLDSKTIIYSSPFSRCKKTAEIAKKVLNAKGEIHFDDRLKERYFGDFERTHISNYQKVWDIDINNPDHKNFNVESASEVQNRTLSLINDLENKYDCKKILLVSHGDALQILQTGFLNKSPKEHRNLPYLHTAEIRELKLK